MKMDGASTSSSHPQIFLFYIFFFRASWRIVYMRVFAFLKSNNFNFNFVSLEHMILSHFASKHLFIPLPISVSGLAFFIRKWYFHTKMCYFRTFGMEITIFGVILHIKSCYFCIIGVEITSLFLFKIHILNSIKWSTV